MQLLLNATSPFARLVRVVALEKGLADRLELVWVDPWTNDPQLLAAHPQGRVPVLVTDEGPALSESLLIAQYLDDVGPGPALLPATQRAAHLARCGVGYGLMEAAFTTMIARKHQGPSADASELGLRRSAAMVRDLQWLEADVAQWTGVLRLEHLVVAVALDYLDFRLPAVLAQQALPRLQAWRAAVAGRESLRATAFPAAG